MPYADPQQRKAYQASYRAMNHENLREKKRARSPEQQEQRRIAKRIRYAAKREQICAQERRYWASKAEMHRDQRLRRRYGINVEQLDAIIDAQRGKCALCEETLKLGTKSVHVDHCHETGKVRGVLCARCNLGIGRFGDHIRGLERAIEYLKRSL
jgi:hypothetical protein